MSDEFEPQSGMIFETTNGIFGLIIAVNGRLLYLHPNWGATTVTAPFVSNTYAITTAAWGIKSIYEGFWLENSYRTDVYVVLPELINSKILPYHVKTYLGKKLWTRELEIKEISLKEIAAKFDVDVKQIRIKDYKHE